MARAGGEEDEAVVAGRGEQRGATLLPVGQQLGQGARLDHRAGEDVRADLAALFHHAHGGLRRQLLQPDGGGQARGPCAHDHDVELHCLAL